MAFSVTRKSLAPKSRTRIDALDTSLDRDWLHKTVIVLIISNDLESLSFLTLRATKVTEGHEQDPSQVPDLLDQVDREINRFVGDGIYDQEPVYEAVAQHSPRGTRSRGDRTAEERCCPFQRLDWCSLSARPTYCGDLEQGPAKLETPGRLLFTKQSRKRNVSLQVDHRRTTESLRMTKLRSGNLRLVRAILNRMREMGRPLSYAVR